MTNNNTYTEINEKLDFLLKDHGVADQVDNKDLESLENFHDKADALLVAHGLDVPEVEKDIVGLQPKLSLLIEGHGAEFDESGKDSDSLELVIEKLNILTHEHGEE